MTRKQDARRCLTYLAEAIDDGRTADPATVACALAVVEDYFTERRLVAPPAVHREPFTAGAA